jgi:polyferredoxin
VTNVGNGTYFFAGEPTPGLFGQVIVLLVTIGLLAVFVLTPVCVFMFLTIKAIGEELARLSGVRKSLEARLAETRSAEEANRLRLELEQIRERRKTAGRQRLLPIKQPAFLVLLAASLVLLIALPLFIPWFGGTSPAITEGGSSISDAVCAACGNAPLRSR